MKRALLSFLFSMAVLVPVSARADGVGFSTGPPDGKMAMASRPPGAGIEIEAADDFPILSPVQLTGARFTGLLVGGTITTRVAVAIYRIFPLDSDTVRTPAVPTRTNSPSDDEFVSRDTADGNLLFSATTLSATFTALNSVLNNITVAAGGEGPVTGQETEFDVTFSPPILLTPGHYFFVPQVLLSSGQFYWLSAPKPIVPPGTPFPVEVTDLQTWMRNSGGGALPALGSLASATIAPDWLRVGTDITGSGPFNGTFSLGLEPVPPLELSDAHLFVGLKNSDDQGTQFDLKVELLKNGTAVASGLERCLTGVTRNPLKASEGIVPFDASSVNFTSGDILALRVSTRIGTNPDDTKCLGPGGSHNNAAGLRLYYDSLSRESRFDINGGDLFLRSDGNPCANAPSTGVTNRVLDTNHPTSTDAKCKDSGKLNFAGGNPFSEIGTWSMMVP